MPYKVVASLLLSFVPNVNVGISSLCYLSHLTFSTEVVWRAGGAQRVAVRRRVGVTLGVTVAHILVAKQEPDLIVSQVGVDLARKERGGGDERPR